MISYRLIMMLMLAYQNPMDDLKIPCSDCHHPDGWMPLNVNMKFEHEKTSFPLTGNHNYADCVQCHFGSTTADKHNFKQSTHECYSCHFDIHQTSFGQECEECHTTFSWDLTQFKFDHDFTLFPLLGMHRQIECSACHNKPLSVIKSDLSFTCSACHVDVFIEAKINGHSENEDCIICHNTRSWIPSDMSNHDRMFPIYSGKHAGEWTTCEAECHVNPTDYTDFSCGLNGVCHDHDKSEMDDEHLGEVSGYVYDSQACFQCHPRGDED